MTALKEYARLETTGIWRPEAEAQRKEVYVSFGDATLVISDQAGRPLTHWSLAAVERLNPRARPALFSPDGNDAETLEIEDDGMIDAIGQVQRAIARARPRPGRLRLSILAMSTSAIAALGLFWLPGALISQAVTVVPEVKRAEIGRALLERTAALTGQTCSDPFGTIALRRLQGAVAPGRTLHVVREGLATTQSLPGGHVLLSRQVIEDFDDPSVAAGFVVAELTRAKDHDPLRALLDASGARSAFRLLTTGSLSPETLDAYAEAMLTEPRDLIPAETLLMAFREAQVPARPYAYAVDVTGESTFELIEADPYVGVAPVTHLTDGEWLSLQSICQG